MKAATSEKNNVWTKDIAESTIANDTSVIYVYHENTRYIEEYEIEFDYKNKQAWIERVTRFENVSIDQLPECNDVRMQIYSAASGQLVLLDEAVGKAK